MQWCLDKGTEEALIDYVLNLEDGIYYIYEARLTVLPVFASKQANSGHWTAYQIQTRSI